MNTPKPQYTVNLFPHSGRGPTAVQEVFLVAVVERLEALVNSVDKLREALISMKPGP